MRRTLTVFAVIVLILTPLAAPSSGSGPSLPSAGAFAASPAPQSAVLANKLLLPAVSVAHPLTSDQLIDRALAAGTINGETALVYKVYASFGDRRLPPPYHGDDSHLIDSHILDQVRAQYPTMSAPTQLLVAPFLMPPVYVGSWFYLRAHPAAQQAVSAASAPVCTEVDAASWAKKASTSHPFTIWWESARLEDSAVADRMVAALDTDIWGKLTSLMGSPLPDGATNCAGDPGRVDIYLLHGIRASAPSLTPPGCKQTPAYIQLDVTDDNATLAHEFMHVLQWSYAASVGCLYPGEYAWLMEATAEWSMEYVYPGTQDTRDAADEFMRDPKLSLDLRNDEHEYDAWVFFYFLQRTQGAAAVRSVWDAVAGKKSLNAIDGVVSNGFAGAWQQFVRWNWNRPPVDYYAQAGLASKAKADEIEVKLNGGADASLQVGPAVLRHLSAKYTWLHFTDPKVRTVMFFNGLSFKVSIKPLNLADGSLGYLAEPVTDEQKKGVSVWALVKINGAWKAPENWTGRDVVTFCRDKASENIQELVLMYGNSAFEPIDYLLQAQGLAPTLYVSNLGCWKWEGKTTSTLLALNAQPGTSHLTHADDLVWENKSGVIYPSAAYELVRGHVRWSVTTSPGCGPTGSGTADESGNPAGTMAFLRTYNGITSGASYRGMVGAGSDTRSYGISETCLHQSGSYPTINVWFETTVLPPFTVPATGVSKGEYVPPWGKWTWDLSPSSAP